LTSSTTIAAQLAHFAVVPGGVASAYPAEQGDADDNRDRADGRVTMRPCFVEKRGTNNGGEQQFGSLHGLDGGQCGGLAAHFVGGGEKQNRGDHTRKQGHAT